MTDWIEAFSEYAEALREADLRAEEMKRRERRSRELAEARRAGQDEVATAMATREAQAFLRRSFDELMRERTAAVAAALRPHYMDMPKNVFEEVAEQLLDRSLPRARFSTGRDDLHAAQVASDVVTITLPDLHYRFIMQRAM